MNWGNKLLLTFIVFIGGMGYLVYRSMGTDFQLVEKEYYRSELKYQEVIDGKQRASELSAPVRISEENGTVVLQFPSEMQGKADSGRVWFYCPYESANDRQFALSLDAGAGQRFEAGSIRPGKYLVKIEWTAGGQSYYSEIPFEFAQ